MSRTVLFKDLGLISYKEAWTYQQGVHDEIKRVKKANRDQPGSEQKLPNQLIFCQHPPVYTLGKSGSEDHILISKEEREQKSIEYFKINRGGDITFHGPGQLVVYPIFDMDDFYHDVHKYVRELEEVIIRTLASFDIAATRIDDYTGVWLAGDGTKPERKICAIGVHLSRWVTLHGLAFNIDTDLDFFSYIIPCGINEPTKAVTTLQQETTKSVKFDIVQKIVKHHFAEVFCYTYET